MQFKALSLSHLDECSTQIMERSNSVLVIDKLSFLLDYYQIVSHEVV